MDDTVKTFSYWCVQEVLGVLRSVSVGGYYPKEMYKRTHRIRGADILNLYM